MKETDTQILITEEISSAFENPSVPKDSFGRVLWSSLCDKPDELKVLIESQARAFMETGNPLSQSSLVKEGRSGLVSAIQQYYPGQMRGLKVSLGLEVRRKPDGYWNDLNNIETEAKKFIETGQRITESTLDEAGMRSLSHAISDHYPGGIKGLRQRLGLEPRLHARQYQNIEVPNEGFPRDRRGRMVTSIFRDQPEEMQRRIEEEARRLIDEGIELTDKSLKTKKMTGFPGIIDKFYPEGRMGLRNTLGLVVLQRPAGYWEDPEVIESEARKLVEKGNKLTQKELMNAGMSSLSAAIQLYYPGRIYGLRAKLGLQELQRPRGYWIPENIEAEALKHIDAGHKLTSTELKKAGKGNFVAAIFSNYPGGIRALREKLGIKQPGREMGYWKDIKNIEKRAEEFIRNYGTLTQGELNRNGEGSLCAAIQKNYPGGLSAIKEKFGIKPGKKPDGYWDVEKIEKEAKKFLEEFGELTGSALSKANRNDLAGAINFHYPGKLRRLKESLAIPQESVVPGYWTDEKIIEEAKAFYEEHGNITHKFLRKRGRTDLSSAIHRLKDGMDDVRKNLGLKRFHIDKEYWTPENIEREIKKFYSEEGALNQRLITERKRNDLLVAIRYYPGGMRALRVKLGISDVLASVEVVLPDQANEQLEKLLEVRQ